MKMLPSDQPINSLGYVHAERPSWAIIVSDKGGISDVFLVDLEFAISSGEFCYSMLR